MASDLTPSEIEPAVAAVTNFVTSPELKLVLILLSAELIEIGVAGVLGVLGVPGMVLGAVAVMFVTAALSCSTTLPCVTAAVFDMAVKDSAMVAP